MAESLAHRWGQIIGDGFEMFVRNVLGEVAQRHGLYLDFKRPRKTRGGQGKVTWQDGYGNKHDLDYVLERGGTEETLGVPIAFVESAWRRYTKHSKNKVQEIEAAVMPIALTFSRHQPFCGAVLAGEFRAEVFTLSVAWSSPWMILPRLTWRPRTWERTSASNANSNRSSLVSLLRKTKRMGINWAGLPRPSDGTRSTA